MVIFLFLFILNYLFSSLKFTHNNSILISLINSGMFRCTSRLKFELNIINIYNQNKIINYFLPFAFKQNDNIIPIQTIVNEIEYVQVSLTSCSPSDLQLVISPTLQSLFDRLDTCWLLFWVPRHIQSRYTYVYKVIRWCLEVTLGR